MKIWHNSGKLGGGGLVGLGSVGCQMVGWLHFHFSSNGFLFELSWLMLAHNVLLSALFLILSFLLSDHCINLYHLQEEGGDEIKEAGGKREGGSESQPLQ